MLNKMLFSEASNLFSTFLGLLFEFNEERFHDMDFISLLLPG